MTSFFVVQVVVCGLAAMPAVALWWVLLSSTRLSPPLRFVAIGLLTIPSYALFALCLMVVSPAVTWLLGWRAPPHAALRIVDLDWELLTWVRYVSSIRVVSVLSGTLFCGSPLWATYLRLNGARVGRGVFVNSMFVSDHNLLDIGEHVVIGAGVHLSGHTVENGIVKTGPVRLGSNVTVGIGTIVDIDVEVGDGCQIGALSLVPKHSRLAAGAVYVGVPVRRRP